MYLYYAPQTVTDVKLSDGSVVTQTTPNTTSCRTPRRTLSAWDPYVGYFQLSRFKFVEDASGPHLDLNSEQQILRVNNNRQECCHVAGDIDFDKHDNLWMVTGDDTPAGGIHANGYGPFEDELTDEQQTVRVTNATGGTFTLTFNGQTTAPLPFNATARAGRLGARGALEHRHRPHPDQRRPGEHGEPERVLPAQPVAGRTRTRSPPTASGLTGTSPTVTTATAQEGGWFQRPDRRRPPLDAQHQRPARQDPAHQGQGQHQPGRLQQGRHGLRDGRVHDPVGQPEGLLGGALPGVASQADFNTKFRPEIYAMGFRNPFRLQVDENDVAYVSDYSPDAKRRSAAAARQASAASRSCASRPTTAIRSATRRSSATTSGTSRVRAGHDDRRHPGGQPAAADRLRQADAFENDSRWVRDGGPAFEPGLRLTPPLSDPDIWYSYRDNNASAPLGTPCFGFYATTPGAVAPGSTTECPRLFPELYTGGVGPHGIAKYHYDPDNPSTTKFPPYYDDSVILGEFTQDTLREVKVDAQNRVFKINRFLRLRSGEHPEPGVHVRVRQPDGHAVGRRRIVLPADLRRRVLQHQRRRRHVPLGLRQGHAPAEGRAQHGPHRRPSPLTVNFSSDGSLDEDQGDSIRFEWNFGDGSAISTDPNPTHVYSARGRFTAVLTVTDSSGSRPRPAR